MGPATSTWPFTNTDEVPILLLKFSQSEAVKQPCVVPLAVAQFIVKLEPPIKAPAVPLKIMPVPFVIEVVAVVYVSPVVGATLSVPAANDGKLNDPL